MAFAARKLARDDMDDAARVHRAAFDDRLPWLAGLHTNEDDRAFFRDRVFSRNEVWGAFDGGLAGFIAWRPGFVDQLYVLPRHQRKGAGGLLLGLAMAANETLDLYTFQRNAPARRFYEARGFVAVCLTDGSGNEEREPDVLYRWRRTAETS